MTPITVERRWLILWHGYSTDRYAVSRWGFTENHAHDRAWRAWERAVDRDG